MLNSVRFLLLVFTLVVLTGTIAIAQPPGPKYTIRDLGTLGGAQSQGTGINNLGQVTGWSFTATGRAHAFVWNGSTMQDIGTLGGLDSVGDGINRFGQVTGFSSTPDGIRWHPFLWDGVSMRDLGQLGTGSNGSYQTNSVTSGINDAGHVTGNSFNVNNFHVFLWNGTSMLDIGPGGGRGFGQGINENDQITGFASFLVNGSSEQHAFLWNGTALSDLGSLGGESYGNAINNMGQVAGWSQIASPYGGFAHHAVLWNGTETHDLGRTFAGHSYAYGLNQSADVVGSLQINASSVYHAVLWTGASVYDLNDQLVDMAGWTELTSAQAINGDGQITGFGTIGGQVHAFLLTPVIPPDAISVTTNIGGATFTITGPTIYSGSGTSFSATNAPSGTYTIIFGPVPGYGTPPSQTMTLVPHGRIYFGGSYYSITDAGQVSGLSFTYPSQSGIVCTYFTGVNTSGTPVSHILVGSSGFPTDVQGRYDFNPNMEQYVWHTNTNGTYVLEAYPTGSDCTSATAPIGYASFNRTASNNNYGTVGHWSVAPVSTGGNISVATNLATGTFTITGPVTYTGSGTSFTQANAPAGTYTITYGAVNCFAAPASETKTLAAGGTLTFSAGNYQGRASISVSIAPIGATSATFSINPPVPGLPSNGPYPRTQNNVWPQSYTVSFNPVAGFTPPAAQTSAPNSSCQLAFTGTYTPNVSPGMAMLSVTVSPNTTSLGKFTIADGQGKVIASSVSSFSSPLPGGKYTIKYAPLGGFYTPTDRTVVHVPPAPTSITGKYRRLILVSFTGWGNAPFLVGGSSGCLPVPNCLGYGVDYPDTALSCSGRGMTNLILEARGLTSPPPAYLFPNLAPGLASRAFPFYDGGGSACVRPSSESDHAIAEAWVRGLNPTEDDIIAVVGHSYGGNRARLFAEQLRANQVRRSPTLKFATDALILVDPVDWTACSITESWFNVGSHFSDPGCFQTGFPRELPQSVGAFKDFTQSQGIRSGLLTGYPISINGVIQQQLLTNFTDEGHTDIDDDGRVHLFILQALSGLVRGPTPTTSIAGTPSRDNSGISYPIRVTATPYGTATGFGTATGVKITSATLNGVPVSSILPSSNIGDIVAGSSSSQVTLLFPASAAAKGSAVLLTVTLENADGAPYTNTIRQVAP